MSKRVLNVETTSQPFESMNPGWLMILLVGFVVGGFMLLIYWVDKLSKHHGQEHQEDNEALTGFIGDSLNQMREDVNNAVAPLGNAVAPHSEIAAQSRAAKSRRPAGGMPTIPPRKHQGL